MKAFNYVLSVLVLLLAIASAVFAYFLFEKREQMTKGWGMLATAIHNASAKLDSESGSSFNSELTDEKLSHLAYDGLSRQLSTFQKQIDEFWTQRNDLANDLILAGKAAGAERIPGAAVLTATESYGDAADGVIRSIAKVKEQLDNTANQIAAVGRELNAGNADYRSAGTYANSLRGLITRSQNVMTQLKTFRNETTRIAEVLGAPVSVPGDNDYSSVLADVKTAAVSLKSNRDKLFNDINREGTGYLAQIAARDNTITSLNQEIASRDATIRLKDNEISRLIAVIDPESNGKKPDLWDDGGIESRRALRGNVIDVNDKFGIITVDLGNNTRVKQLIGRNWVEVDPMIAALPANLPLAIFRETDDERPDYIGQLKIVRVDDACSIAELVRGSNTKNVRVGDFVVIAEENLTAVGK